MLLKNELQHLISGIGKYAEADIIQTITHHLRKCKKTSGVPKAEIYNIKEQEAESLIEFANKNNLYFTTLPSSDYLTEGAEQKVYLLKDGQYVIKTNDSIFYENWTDYFHSLLLHNFFFPATKYKLLGFYIHDKVLYSIVKQPFVKVTEPTNIDEVKRVMLSNGFQLKKNNDYYHSDLGLIIEDLHDENVITNHGVLFFIDTVFYIKKSQIEH
ncbi:MAG: hypothetical protein KA319_10725 [Ferruginibacter sp.]|nr:hypothetical protein [Ferruginibacter sp.]